MSTTQITFHDFPSSTALQQRIRELREQLDRFHPHILGCRVAIEASKMRKERGAADRGERESPCPEPRDRGAPQP